MAIATLRTIATSKTGEQANAVASLGGQMLHHAFYQSSVSVHLEQGPPQDRPCEESIFKMRRTKTVEDLEMYIVPFENPRGGNWCFSSMVFAKAASVLSRG